MRNNTASMMPHPRLHPSAPMSIVRVSSRPASATLSEPVNVSTMMRPKRISETRSIGSSARRKTRLAGVGMPVRYRAAGGIR